ncbi:MAG TPA: ATP-binding protein [Rhizomicrobium sp.]|nr:ATP-binding protein [Rhizomicrobium sp.]
MWKGLHLESDRDPRVLKAQLDVIAGVEWISWITTPAWALVLAWLGSASCGWLGRQNLAVAAIYPLIVTLVSFAGYGLYAAYRKQVPPDAAALRRWVILFLWVQAAISAAWGLLPWILWTDGDLPNHLYLLLAITAILSSLMLSRASSVAMFLTGMIPIVGLTVLRFALSGSWIDITFALLVPLFAAHLYQDGCRFILRLQEDARLRFSVEDLAGALAEARDEAVKKRFEAENANASKTAFLANMSHELRTPLNAVLGFSDLIAAQALGPGAMERYSEYAGDIHASGEHLLSLINDLLDVAKIEAGKMEIQPVPLDPVREIDHAVRLVAPRLAQKSQQLEVAAMPDLPLVMADERAFRQMLLNLLSNASKFTQPGGQIVVSCKADTGAGMEMCISDNGPGIPAEKLAHIFQPFSQIDNRYDREAGGTGLGLALVQGLAHLHGGKVWLESAPGGGVKAHLYFPETMPRPPQRKSA